MNACKCGSVCVCVWVWQKLLCASQSCERSVKEDISFPRSPSPSLSLSTRVVRLDWSHPGRPSGIMLGYDVLRRALRSCAAGSKGVTSSAGGESGGARLRCSYLQCPASHAVCGTSCFHPHIQVIMLRPLDAYFICSVWSTVVLYGIIFMSWYTLNITTLTCMLGWRKKHFLQVKTRRYNNDYSRGKYCLVKHIHIQHVMVVCFLTQVNE